MAKRVPPTTEQVTDVIRRRLDLVESAEFLPTGAAETAVRTAYSTTRARAQAWLWEAFDAGALAVVGVRANGKHLERLTVDPANGERTWTLLRPGLLHYRGILDMDGRVHLAEELPAGKAPAPTGLWVTLPHVLETVIDGMIRYRDEVYAQHAADTRALEARADAAHGDALARIRNLMDGLDPGRSELTVRWYEGEPHGAHVTIRVSNEAIDQLGDRLLGDPAEQYQRGYRQMEREHQLWEMLVKADLPFWRLTVKPTQAQVSVRATLIEAYALVTGADAAEVKTHLEAARPTDANPDAAPR